MTAQESFDPFDYLKSISINGNWRRIKFKGGSNWVLEALIPVGTNIDSEFLNKVHYKDRSDYLIIRINPELHGYIKSPDFCRYMGFSSANLSRVKHKYKSISVREQVVFYKPPIKIETAGYKDVVGYEGLYKVSSQGVVYSCLRNKVIKLLDTNMGYKRVCLYNSNIPKHISVHRIVAEAFLDNPENKPEVNHINGVKTDNRVENLEWVTRSENMKHGFSTGLIKISDKCKEANRSRSKTTKRV